MAELDRQVGTDNRAVVLVGPLPPPIGGVSSHVHRLAGLLADIGVECTVLDAYPAVGKTAPPGVRHVQLSGRARWARLALTVRRSTRSDCVMHLHFSRLVGRLLLVALLCVRRRRVFYLTLHNGDPAQSWQQTSALGRFAARIALSRMSKVIALSSEQLDFYRSLGLPERRLDRWADAIPIRASADVSLLPPEVRDVTAVEDGGEASVLVTSGYPRDTYGYELCLDLLDCVSKRFEACLVVCLYGRGSDPSYEQDLRARLVAHPRVVLLDPMPAEAFVALLSRASVYLRPSREDSYGLTVSDALDAGTPCLASDICARDERADIFPTGDREAFLAEGVTMVERGRLSGRPRIGPPSSVAAPDEYLRRYSWQACP